MNKTLIATVLGTATLLAGSPAVAQVKPEDVIKYRQGLYQVVGWQNRTMATMVKGQAPFDAAEFARAAEIVALMAATAPGAFAPGSDKGAPTRAKPEIWSDAAGFKKAVDSFQAESAKLAQVAKGAKDVDAVRAQFGALVKTCGACHDNFRTK
jgi:cytochrome c556